MDKLSYGAKRAAIKATMSNLNFPKDVIDAYWKDEILYSIDKTTRKLKPIQDDNGLLLIVNFKNYCKEHNLDYLPYFIIVSDTNTERFYSICYIDYDSNEELNYGTTRCAKLSNKNANYEFGKCSCKFNKSEE